MGTWTSIAMAALLCGAPLTAQHQHQHPAPPPPPEEQEAAPQQEEHGAHAMPDQPGMEHAGHEMPMPGMFGPYPMSREASGTAWQPESAPHTGLHAMRGDWHLMAHGFANLVYDEQDGPRGDDKLFGESMLMGMAVRELGRGRLGRLCGLPCG